MHDVTKMPIIGKVTTKPLTYNVTFGDKTQAYEMPAETYSVVHIFEDDGQKTYVTNVWHKEYKRVPLLIIEKLVDNYQPILEEGGYLHGSSHEFCDTGFKLDTEKEGQGESLFGRGLYFTKDQKLAEYYAKFVKPEGVNDAIRQKVADKLGFKTYDEIPYDFENKKIKTKYGEHLKFDLFHQYLKQYVDKSKEKGNIYKVTLFPGKDNSEYRILDFSGENHQLQENIERDKKDLKNIIDTLVKNKRKYSTWIKSYFDDKGLEFDPEKYNSDFKSTLRDMKDYYDNFYTYSTSTPLLKNLAYDLKKIFKPEFFRFTKNPLELTNDPNHYMSLQENRVKFNEDAKIYQGKRLTDFFQEAGYNAITYSFSPSIIPLEDNGEYDANAIVIFNDKDVKIDECEKAEDGKNIYSKPKLIKKSVLNDFQSGSSLDFYDNKIFVVGDDTKDLLIINSDFEELNRVRLFESPDRRIAKDLKADLETSTIINHNGTPSILMLGSGARDNKSFGYIVPFGTLKVTEPFKYDVFINRLKDEHGIEKVNIEGSASMEDDFILSNRGNKNNPDNFLIITENNFWENQSTVKISLSRLLLPNKDAGVSEIYYETDSDTLFFTASVEQTTNNYDDGEIGDSFIGYISSFSNKLNENTITPDLFLNLTEIDSSFDKQKIEGICIENKSGEYYTINLVSDNDNDESTIFKIELKKQNIAADGKKIPERYRNMGFTKVGQKKKSTRPEKKWMVLARKGDKYKVVHGGYKGMQDYSQHHDDVRRKRFWNRMGGFDSEKANDPFSPLYWHKKFGTWEDGGRIISNEGLSYLLGKKSEVEQIGSEKKSPVKSSFNDLTIELYISEYGSYRFVAIKNEEVVSAIQVMSKDGKVGYVSNAYTRKDYRNKGVGSELIKFIRKYFTEITFSEDRSILGERFVNSIAENGADIPVMDEETYLAINGAPSGFGDPALHKNRGGMSDKAWTKIVDRQAAKDRELMAKRESLRQEYNEKVEKGEIRPPNRNEKLISIAQGHPDLESTQAARRILQKKGVSWE